MPPAKIPITTGVDEFKIVAIAHRGSIDLKVLQESLVLWFLVVESEVVVFGVRRLVAAFSGALPHGRATAPICGAVPKFKQSALNFRHAVYCFNLTWRG